MPTVAILSDIHANLPALETVLSEVRDSGADDIVFLGDIVGYGASPAECVDLVRKTGGACLMGNHDVEISKVRKRGCTFSDPDWKCLPYQAGLALAAQQLNTDQAQWLAALPYRLRLPGALAAHGSLNEPEAFNYIKGDESSMPTLEILRKERSKVGFFGHTHVQGVFCENAEALAWLDESRVVLPEGLPCAVTVGSVGQPHYELRATWVLWHSESRIVEFRKTPYDRLKAARAIAKAGLPMESSLALMNSAEVNALLGRD